MRRGLDSFQSLEINEVIVGFLTVLWVFELIVFFNIGYVLSLVVCEARPSSLGWGVEVKVA